MPRVCLLRSAKCSDGGYALPGSSRCGAHGGRRQDPRTTTAKGLGADHQALRLQAFRRVGADQRGLGGRCEACGRPGVVGNPLEGAHLRARALGGQNRLDNYAAIHRAENRGEGDRIRRVKAAIEKRQTGGAPLPRGERRA